ncbi:MAG: response regulator [Parvularculaceae bacterium]
MAKITPPAEDAPHILIVDDDDRIRTLLQRYLSENGYHTSVAADASDARRVMSGLAFDLLVLDVMMPGEDGLSLTRSIRGRSDMPILLLTAKGDPDDRIAGLEQGADDYLAKPFEPRELLLRVKNLIRRTQDETRKSSFTFGECTFLADKGELRRAGELIKLTSSELALLRALVKKPGAAITREALAQQTSAAMERSVDVQVTRLRKKIEDDPRCPLLLQTVRGIGYALMVD